MPEQEQNITAIGNPSNPTGEAGALMLEQMNEHHSDVTAWGSSHFDFKDGDIVLDIGCGGGATLNRIAREHNCGMLYGIDHSPISVRSSTEINRAFIDSGKMKILEASVESLPFPDSTFDKILTVESFYFWKSPVTCLKEVRRVLKAGGKLLIIADIHGGAELTEHDIENIRAYGMYNPTPEEFRSLLTEAGFKNAATHLKDGTKWICAEGVK